MFTNLFLSASLLTLVSLVPPDVNKVDVVGAQYGQCPNGSVIEVTYYKAAGDVDDTVIVVVFTRGGIPVAALDLKERVIYIYADKKEYPLDVVKEKYPSPCDIPHSDI